MTTLTGITKPVSLPFESTVSATVAIPSLGYADLVGPFPYAVTLPALPVVGSGYLTPGAVIYVRCQQDDGAVISVEGDGTIDGEPTLAIDSYRTAMIVVGPTEYKLWKLCVNGSGVGLASARRGRARVQIGLPAAATPGGPAATSSSAETPGGPTETPGAPDMPATSAATVETEMSSGLSAADEVVTIPATTEYASASSVAAPAPEAVVVPVEAVVAPAVAVPFVAPMNMSPPSAPINRTTK